MDNKGRSTEAPSAVPFDAEAAGEEVNRTWRRVIRRRSFLQAGVGLGVAAAALPTGALLAPTAEAASNGSKGGRLPKGDVAILRFLQAVETVENDLWVQYNELGGFNGISNGNTHFATAGVAAAYVAALVNLDGDMPQYISDNADDELSHMLFLAAYLRSRGEEPADLSQFATQPPSKVTGVPNNPRLTNLQNLNVDTSFYTRYRSTENPDAPFNATFTGPTGLTIVNFPGIPRNDDDNRNATAAQQNHIQAIANTASFHFAFIEQGGSSLYPILALKVTDLEVLRVVLSIGGTEIDHFSLWHDKLSGAVSQSPANPTPPLSDTFNNNGSTATATFPALPAGTPGSDSLTQTNLILAEPCDFISESLPECSVIRPTSVEQGGAVATINAFAADGLFAKGSPLFDRLMELAEQADEARRQGPQ